MPENLFAFDFVKFQLPLWPNRKFYKLDDHFCIDTMHISVVWNCQDHPIQKGQSTICGEPIILNSCKLKK